MPNNDSDSTFHRYHRGDVGETAPSMLVRLQDKEDTAIETFVEIYTKLVRAWCRRASRKLSEPLLRDERKDIASLVIAKAVQKLCEKNTEPIKNLRAWLHQITKNSIVDFLRKRNKQKPVWQQLSDTGRFNALPDSEVPDSEMLLDLSDEQKDKLIILDEITNRIKSTIKNEHWEVFHQTVVEGKTSEEVAEAMNMTGASVRQIKKRVLDRIRQDCIALGIEDERQ
jgi:RNA polymerase sigma factor (sigma-70 family)